MNLSPALRLAGLAAAVTLGSCGYAPLYAPGAGATNAASKVEIGEVTVQQNTKNVGQRRAAQTVAQDLKLSFPNSGTEMDTVSVYIEETTSTLAVERTAAIQRAQIDLTAVVTLTNANGEKLLVTSLATNAPYNVEDTPYSTESGKTYARTTAARNLASEITRRLYLYYSTHKQTTSKPSTRKPASSRFNTVNP
jgi:hypothetical protein